MYDTVDRLRLRRIDVAERTDDATTYQKVDRDPDGSRREARAGSRQVSAKMGKHGPMFWRRQPRWLRRAVFIGFFSFALMLVAGTAVVYAATQVPLPGEVKTDQTTVLYYNDGSQEVARIGTVNRTDVPLEQVSEAAIHAVLAAENKDFYDEPGISPRGIARALWVNVTNGEVAQGGSTITQQYAKNAYLTQDRTFTRKMREIVLAVKLDQKYSKDEILEFYLNTIYFGRGAYGIEAAAKTYFGVHASELSAEQGAVIAGLIRSPNNLDPRKSPEAAQSRWHDVLDTMIAMDWLDPSEITPDEVPPETLERDLSNGQGGSAQASYIREQVKRELMNDIGLTEDQINLDGLRVYTTLDYERQMHSFAAVNQVISEAYGQVPELRTGLVALDPNTGAVLAWYGGSQFGANEVNGTELDAVSQAAVPAGSTFKAITLAAALREGESLRSVWPAPEEIEVPGAPPVHNDEGHGDYGYVDLIDAMAASINTVFVPLGVDRAGLAVVEQTARDLGIPEEVSLRDTDDQLVAGINLGINDIPALHMASVYGTLANDGKRNTPHIVARVEDGDGAVIYEAPDTEKQGIPASVAADTTHALQAVITDGTGKTNAQLAGGRPAAGKTGTTDDFRSAWFCGYTPQIASCVNMFKGDATEANRLVGIPGASEGVYGGGYPAKIWKAFMDAALANEPVEQFPTPVFGGTAVNSSPSPTVPPTTEPPEQEATPEGVLPSGDIGIDIGDLFSTEATPSPDQQPESGQTGDQQPPAGQPAARPDDNWWG